VKLERVANQVLKKLSQLHFVGRNYFRQALALDSADSSAIAGACFNKAACAGDIRSQSRAAAWSRPLKRQQILSSALMRFGTADYVSNVVARRLIVRQVPLEKMRVRDNRAQRLLQIVTRGVDKML